MQNTGKILARWIVFGLMVAGIAACNRQDSAANEKGPAETAGQQLDQAAERAGQELSKAGEKIGQGLQTLGQKLENESQQAQKKE